MKLPDFAIPVVPSSKRRVTLLVLLLVGLSARLALAYFAYGNYDQDSYEIVARIVSQGQNVYAETFRYNYSPLWSLVLYGLYQTALLVSLPFHFVVRSFLTLIDLINCLLLIFIAARRHISAYRVLFLSFLNPLPLLLTGYHGQFENFALLFAYLAVAVYLLWQNKFWFFLLCAAALIVKHDVVFGLFPMFLAVFSTRRMAVVALSAAALLFLLTFVPYLPGGQKGIVENVLLYPSLIGRWGIGSMRYVSDLGLVLLGVFGILVPLWLRRRWKVEYGALVGIEAFLVFTPGFSNQFLMMPLGLASLDTHRLRTWLFIAYSVTGTICLLSSPEEIKIFPIEPFWNVVWFIMVAIYMSNFFSFEPKLAGGFDPNEPARLQSNYN